MRKRDCAISIRVFRVDEKMETLVGYASEESENSPQLKRETEEDKPDTRTDTQQAPCANLAAEWEAFESLLGGSAFTAEASTSALLKGVPQPVAAPSCSTSGVPAPVCAAPKKEKSRDEEASLSSSEGSDSSFGRSSKRSRERRRQRNSSKGKIKSRVSRSSSSDSDSSNSSYSPSRATANVGDAKKQRLQRSDSSSDDSDSEQHAHSTDSSDSNSPERPRRTFKSSDSEASVDNDIHKDLTSAESKLICQSKHVTEKSGSVSPDSKVAGEVGELRCSPRQTDVSASPSREVTLMDRLLKIAEENCTGEVSKADVVCRAREPSSSRSPSPHKHREFKGRHRSSRSRSREKGRRRGGRRRRSRSWEHSRRRRGRRSRSGSHHRRSESRRRATSRSSVTKSPSKERSRRLSSTTDDCKDTTKSEHKKSRSRSQSRQHRSRSRGHRSRSRGHRRSRSRGHRRSRSRGHRRSRSRGRRSRSRDVRSKKRGQLYSPARSHAFEGYSRGWKKKRPLEKGRNCMMRSPSRSPSRQKARLYKLLKQTAPPEKRLTFKESLLQQLMKMQKDASAGNLMFDPSAIEALESANEKPSSLPLNSSNPLLAMMMAAGGDKVTPQQALLQTMAAMHQKAQELTGVAVPKYYNPAAVNPLKYAEQMQKRKLLWSKVKTDNKEEGAATWGGTSFSQDQDGKVAHKFRKLMGMKEGEEEEEDDRPANEEQQLKQQQLFDQLDKEYEFARMTTHTHRGIGLGFQSLGLPDN